MLIEMHMLKNYPPTNLNRDETGSPKSCYFGGAQRGRISSQSIKYSWRRNSTFSKMPLGIRTQYIPELVADELRNRGIDQQYIEDAKKKLMMLGKKEDKREGDNNDKDKTENTKFTTKQIMFFSNEDIVALSDEVERTINNVANLQAFKKVGVKDWQDILKLKRQVRPITMDMALFGRMITDDSFRDVEACLQVAHAISTHVVNQESDYFTAVDDLRKEYAEDAGSAMIGDTDYNSCCYYFYTSLDTDQLSENLKDSPEVKEHLTKLLPALLESMAFTNPSGKQNSFAGHTYPELICIERKMRKVPISYVNAFEKPVRSTNGYMDLSIKALANHIDQFDDAYVLPVEDRLWFSPGRDTKPQKVQYISSLPGLMDQIRTWLTEV